MAIWAWLLLAFFVAYPALVLWRAWDKSYVKFGPLRYTRAEYPIYFWFFVFLFVIGELWFIAAAVILCL